MGPSCTLPSSNKNTVYSKNNNTNWAVSKGICINNVTCLTTMGSWSRQFYFSQLLFQTSKRGNVFFQNLQYYKINQKLIYFAGAPGIYKKYFMTDRGVLIIFHLVLSCFVRLIHRVHSSNLSPKISVKSPLFSWIDQFLWLSSTVLSK